jgi:hypothetical protein
MFSPSRARVWWKGRLLLLCLKQQTAGAPTLATFFVARVGGNGHMVGDERALIMKYV